ncbi:MAG: DEAD/DEAH box helicase, partial [Planctomycetota bacterium]
MYDRFYKFGLSDEVLNSLNDMGFEEPTQIQKIAIPPVMKGKDIIGVAQTGTGKTAAFGIPIVEKDIRGRSKRPCALVLVPTRELAIQVAQEMNKIGKNNGFVSVPIYGGQSIERQIKSLKKGLDVVVGTPGRIIDHLKRRTLVLSDISTVVLDAA